MTIKTRRPPRLARALALAVRGRGCRTAQPSLPLVDIPRLRGSALLTPRPAAAAVRAVALPSIAVPADEEPSATFSACDRPDS
jgi:hypothetical protein